MLSKKFPRDLRLRVSTGARERGSARTLILLVQKADDLKQEVGAACM
jgi:hypothetical protein